MCSYKSAESLQQAKLSNEDLLKPILSTLDQIKEAQDNMRQDIDLLMKSVKEIQSWRHVKEGDLST